MQRLILIHTPPLHYHLEHAHTLVEHSPAHMFDHFLHDSDFSPLIDLSTTSALAALPSVHAYHRPMHRHPAVPHLSVGPLLSEAKHPDVAHPFETPEMRQVRETYEQLRCKYRDMRVEKMVEAYADVARQARQLRQAKPVSNQKNSEDSHSRGEMSAAQQRFSMTNTDAHQRTTSSSRMVSQTHDEKGRATTEEQTAHKDLVDGKVVVNRKSHTRKGPDGKVENLLQKQKTLSNDGSKKRPNHTHSTSRSSSSTRKASAPKPPHSASKPTRAASRKTSSTKPKEGTRKASSVKK